MAFIKKPCFDFDLKGKDKNFSLTPKQIRPIWEYAKKRYLNNGYSFEDTINALKQESNKPARFFEEVMTGGKTIKKFKTKEALAAEDARRNAIWKAQKAIERADYSTPRKVASTISDLPRAALTAFHGGVFPVTHAGGLLLQPSAWRAFWNGALMSWKVAGVPGLRGRLGTIEAMARYEKMRLDFLNLDRYADWRNSGLRIGIEERSQGVLSGWLADTPGWSSRAWLGVMKIRYNYAENLLKQVPKAWMRTPEDIQSVMKSIAEQANHATGVTNLPFGRWLGQSRSLFAPQLTASKLLRVTHDPAKALGIAYKWMRGGSVDAGERAYLYLHARHAGEMLMGWAAGLYLNDAMLRGSGSKQRINWDKYNQSDWLRFKSGVGDVFSSRGPEEDLRLFGQLIAIPFESRRELHGKDPWFAAMDHINRFTLYKLSPGIGTASELALGTDLFGRPLPDFIQKARGAVGMRPLTASIGKPQYTTPEYLWTHAPIFLDGPARDVYDDMRARGMSQPDADALVHAAVMTALEFTGLGAYAEKEQGQVVQPRRTKKYQGVVP